MGKAKYTDKAFILVEAEMLSPGDEFMQHRPRNKKEAATKELINEAIYAKVKNFYRPKYDPSLTLTTSGRVGICFEPDKEPAMEVEYKFWVEAAKNYNPERNSRLGTRLEYGAFLGVLIKKFVAAGKSLEWAWNAVCNDSREVGNYRDSENHESIELTGSRCFFGFCDLGNTYKILADEDYEDAFWLAGGAYLTKGKDYPLADIAHYFNLLECFYNSVGWVVMS